MRSPRGRMPQQGLNRLWLTTICAITVATLSGSFVTPAFGAPAKLDGIAPPPESPFPLEAQPTQFSDAIAAALNIDNGEGDGGVKGVVKNQPSAIDSYGNPIETLKPIDTPDGRKVISAQGLQFEIPNYASGITEIKKPADDLLPPLIDPIAVAVSTDLADGATGTSSVPEAMETAISATTVDVENAQLVELNPKETNVGFSSQAAKKSQIHNLNSLPSYILELNDPDIGGPVEYMPADDGSSLKVIAWDLLPPLEKEPIIITSDNQFPKHVTGIEDPLTHNIKVSLTAGQSIHAQAPLTGVVSLISPQGNSIYSTSSTTTTPKSNTARTTRPTTTTTTTTTRATTTTRRPTTTTTRRTTTTKRTPTTTTTTRNPAPLNPNDFYQLENGDSYTLPSWLADIDDPELDAAVSFIVPEDIHEYNDTISRDILPPLEPYTDLNDIELPEDLRTTSTTTSRPGTTSTTSKPRQTFSTTPKTSTVSTSRPHWVRAYPTTAKISTTTTTQRPNSFDDRFSPNHIAQTHDLTLASSATLPNSKVHTSFLSNNVISSTTTTTQKPRLTTSAAHQHHTNRYQQDINKSNESSSTIVDHTASTEVKNSQEAAISQFSNSNPFLPAHNSATRPFSSQNVNKFTTTTTTSTTTTTTPATPIEENPFESATLPSWLADFDYPDLAPGVPFTYNADEPNSDVSNDLLPPSQLITETTDTTKPVFITSSPTSFNSFQIAPSSTNRHDSTFASASTSTTRTFAFNNFPSKVITTAKPFNIQTPFAKVPNSNNYNQEAVTLPPVLFIPPTAETESNIDIVAVNDVSKTDPQTDRENANNLNHHQQPSLQPAATADQILNKKSSSSSFNKNFAAPFEPTSTSGSADSSASTEQDFGSSTKTTFSKSNEGKVITNNVFGTSSGVTTTSKQVGFSASTAAGQANFQKDFQQSTSERFPTTGSSFIGTSNAFNKAATPSAFATFSSAQQNTNFNSFNNKGTVTNVDTGKYTGGFGGSPGILGSGKLGSAVRTDGSIRPTSNVAFTQTTAIPPTAPPKFPTNPNFANRVGNTTTTNKYQGTFGGPPGVLNPFDNVKSG